MSLPSYLSLAAFICRRTHLSSIVLLLVLFGNQISWSQCAIDFGFDAAAEFGNRFGESIAFDGNHAIVGVPDGNRAILYAFDGASWSEEAVLTSSLSDSSRFGATVAIDGTVLAIGAPFADEAAPDAGAIVVFRFDGAAWQEEQKILIPDGDVMAGDQLAARTLALEDDMIVAGTRNVAEAAVCCFRRSLGSWESVQRIEPAIPDPEFAAGLDLAGRRLAISTSGTASRVDFYRWEMAAWTEFGFAAGRAADRFGPVSADGHRVVVGSPLSNGGEGAAFVYEFDGMGWALADTLNEAGATAFGTAVSLDGDTIVAGAPEGQLSPESGEAYVYRYQPSGWSRVDTIEPADASPGAEFGYSVVQVGDLTLVGAPNGSGVVSNAGAVFSFVASGAAASPMVRASDSSESGWFGYDVDSWGARVLIGGLRGPGVLSTTGAAYFQRLVDGGWLEEQKIFAGDGQNGDFFGERVALHGPVALISATQRLSYVPDPMDPDPLTDGAAYYFRDSGAAWTERQLLLPSGVEPGDEFGRPLVVRNDVAFVTSILDDDGGTDAGAVYVFELDPATDQWSEAQKLVPADIEAFSSFGSSIAVHGNTLAIGNPNGEAESVPASGLVYMYRYDGTEWVLEQKIEPEVPRPQSRFGRTVSLWGGWLAVTTRQDDLLGRGGELLAEDTGSVTLYRNTGSGTDPWVLHQILLPDGIDAFDEFGIAIDVDAGVLAASSSKDELISGPSSGAVYTFRWQGTSWVSEARIPSPEPQGGAIFGVTVTIDAQRLVSGAQLYDEPGGVDHGSVSILSLTASLCDSPFVRGDANLDGIVDVSDVPAMLDVLFLGASTPCLDPLDINLDQSLSISDAFQLLCAIFCVEDSPIPPPYPNCGTNIYSAGVGCDMSGVCP